MPARPVTPTVDVRVGPADMRRQLEEDVRAGLLAWPKSLPPTWFYDERGSRLFEEITRLPEYYLTRAERGLLAAHAAEVAAATRAATLVEIGSGTSEKTRLLLDALAGAGSLRRFVAFDISEETLRAAAARLARDYPGLAVDAVVGDFRHHLDAIPGGRPPRLVAFLGSTVGNLLPDQRRRFFSTLAARGGPDDRVLLGADLVKEPDRLLAAYDDAAGVTAEFNRNVLHVLNARLRADFAPDGFDHVARWDAAARHVEMRLRARTGQAVTLRDLDLAVRFDAGEELRTEVSAKFTPDGLAAELAGYGLATEATWTDGDFLLALLRPAPAGRPAG